MSHLFLFDELMFQFPGHHLQLRQILQGLSVSAWPSSAHVWRDQLADTETTRAQSLSLSLSQVLPSPPSLSGSSQQVQQGLQPLVHAVRTEVRVRHRPVHPVGLLSRGDPALLPPERVGAVDLRHLR